jgi:FkbH-like protein
MNSLYAQLQWLPRPPSDVSSLIRSLDQSLTCTEDIRALAATALDVNQLTKLAKALVGAKSRGHLLNGLDPFRLAIVSNATMDMIVPPLMATGVRHGIAIEIIQSPYAQVAQQAFSPDSIVHKSRPDAVLFALDYRALPIKLSIRNEGVAGSTVQSALEYLSALRNGIHAYSDAICIFQTFATPVESTFGSLDRSVPGTLRFMVNAINDKLTESMRGSDDLLLDIAALAEIVGLADWHDLRLWNMAKLPFASDFIPLYADHVARTLAALRGKSRRVLVLDLDNTLWGGIIGEDGNTGIQIAQGDPIGEAHLAVQRMALDLRERGILLAVCSKNTDNIAREPFQAHPEMLLRLEHFAVFQANWQDKATNIKAIADELSLGLDALVFLDDNPAERALIRQLLPQVAVPELPNDPACYARILAAAGYFEAIAFVPEDLARAGLYQQNAKRVTLREQAFGLAGYLASLEMVITFQPFDTVGRARIVQLINKSNQYNLTTRRYTASEITKLADSPDVFTLQVRLTDIFGDNGMISVVICKPGGEGIWEIDTWLMSCRVLGRGVELMVLRELIHHARAVGVRTLLGTYLPTGRNSLVVDHYQKLGFTQLDEEPTGLTRWIIQVDDPLPQAAAIKVISRGFAAPMDGVPIASPTAAHTNHPPVSLYQGPHNGAHERIAQSL